MISSALIAAGGTGGHIYPGLAVALRLKELGVRVVWIGSKSGMEAKILCGYDFDFYTISVKGIRKSGLLRIIFAPVLILRSIFQSIFVIYRVNPEVVIGMGGYVSGPVGVAAKLCGRKLVIHEQNAIAGLTNKLLCLVANRTLQAFPDTFKRSVKAKTTGNPVRSSISSLPPVEMRRKDESRLSVLIFGGSRGASILNDVVPRAIMISRLQDLSILHQCGEGNESVTLQGYSELNPSCSVTVVNYVEEMADAYRVADLVIARSGAVTVSELAAVGIASILVPYANAVDDHQMKNAHYLVGAGAALLIAEQDLSAENVSNNIKSLVLSNERLLRMGKAARELGFKDSLSLFVDNCIRF